VVVTLHIAFLFEDTLWFSDEDSMCVR